MASQERPLSSFRVPDGAQSPTLRTLVRDLTGGARRDALEAPDEELLRVSYEGG